MSDMRFSSLSVTKADSGSSALAPVSPNRVAPLSAQMTAGALSSPVVVINTACAKLVRLFVQQHCSRVFLNVVLVWTH
jgi:hypothetical protein